MHKELSATLPRPPAEVFPWLLDEDRVPRWSGGVESYEVVGGGPVTLGTRIRQTLAVSGSRRTVEMEVTRLDPPRAAETRFGLEGIEVVNAYTLTAAGDGGTRLAQVVEAKPSGFAARLLLPIVQPHLERKLESDLERLREVLSA
jgi:uncharacterized protein YndB with AHSA1/START domain